MEKTRLEISGEIKLQECEKYMFFKKSSDSL